MSTEFPTYMLLPECGIARHDQHHSFTALLRHRLDVSQFSSLSGVTISQHHDGESSVTSPSHKIQDGCRRQDFGDRISETGFRILLSSAALLLTDQNEFRGFSMTGSLPTWCHNFENFNPQITACYSGFQALNSECFTSSDWRLVLSDTLFGFGRRC